MKIYPAHFFAVMSSVLKYLVSACVFLVLAGSALIDAAPPGFVEGHLKIVSSKEVELADETPSKITAENYADYPLIILSRDGEKEIARVTADENGKYRVALPPGRLCSGCPRPATQGPRPRETATIHDHFKSDGARGHEHRHGAFADAPAKAERRLTK